MKHRVDCKVGTQTGDPKNAAFLHGKGNTV